MSHRDLNPHAPARAAMWLFHKRYADSALGSMGFWDSLGKSEQQLCRVMADEIRNAPDEKEVKP